MKLTNLQIEQYSTKYQQEFANFKSYIPAKTSFYIIKNIDLLTTAAEKIQKTKIKIAEHYGVKKEDGSGFIIPPEKISQATKELDDLYAIEQDIEIKTISIDSLENIEFTPAQMNAIIFMIED